MIGRTNVGGGSARINIANHAILPASGRDNQIALINSTEINDVYCQSTVPDNPVQGDIWIVVTTKGTAYLQFDTIKFFIASIRQYDNDNEAWTYISAWYVWQNNNWITGRLTLIENGSFTGQAGITFEARMWQRYGRSLAGSSTLSEQTYIHLDYLNSKTTSDTNGYGGMCSSVFEVGAFSNLHVEGNYLWTVGSNDGLQRADIMVNNYADSYPDQDALVFYNVKINPATNVTYYNNIDIPIPSTTGDFCIYIGGTCLYYSRHFHAWIINLYLE